MVINLCISQQYSNAWSYIKVSKAFCKAETNSREGEGVGGFETLSV